MGPLYRAFSTLLFGLLLPFLAFHPKLKQGLGRRLGRYPDDVWPPSRGAGPRIWLHGASAGDVLALVPIVTELRSRCPDATLVVSAMTGSGHTMATTRLGALVDAITYVPYDFPFATRRAVAAIRPTLLVLEYAEIWPNLICAARSFGSRIVLVNGRFSESLVPRYRWFHRIFGNPLSVVDLFLMREEVEADRALALGAPHDRVRATGNTKFDNLASGPPEPVLEALKVALASEGRSVFVFGSTHEGEEKRLAAVFRELRTVDPKLLLVVAPRYPERASRVEGIFAAAGFRVELRSALSADRVRAKETDVVVLDTIGELLAAYSIARLVFVGGSFVSRGGQNILEPAGQGRPVLFGPHMANFRDSVEVLVGRGGIQVANPEALARVARELLLRPDEIDRLGEMARVAVSKARGASKRNADELIRLIQEEARARATA
ncbi:MAG: 3-deoxy-D-manno-octulosonic acid transferase [Deltaproteobacteria bacterium]|nr:3-deoxy-D-manno-octulosonic acid transferase [Deltaproteobacteria bacterium]